LTIFQNAKKYDWATWMLGIMRSFISGGSSAMVAGLTSMGIAPGTFNLTNSVGNTLKLMGIMFMFQGGYRMFEFLQLHGAPDRLQQTLQVAEDATDVAATQVNRAQHAVAEAKAIAPQAPKFDE
jgi:hypothetical protein